MALSVATANQISEVLKKAIRDKIKNYTPETKHMPFQYRLIGQKRYEMFSFVHSLNTTFGMSIWEQVAVILAQSTGYHAERQYELFGEIDDSTESLITQYHSELKNRKKDSLIPINKSSEIEQIRQSIKPGKSLKDDDSIVDLYVLVGGVNNYFDITAAKPNKKEFAAMKLKLLRWTGLKLSQEQNAQVFSRLAIPYNPYHPKKYNRWTLRGLYDLGGGEVLVGEEFWNYVGGGNIYEDLLDVFQETGEELKPELDKKFAEFK
jgi:hypothetical protein